MKTFKRNLYMIQTKLLLIEYATINDSTRNHWKLTAIRVIKSLLTQIDFNAETIPLESAKKLKDLLVSLKGGLLTKEESKIAEELITQ